MEKTFIFAGFGGQGMLLIGKFMAMACMLDGKHVSWLPSYGPEMRGGTANCSVIVSDEPVASPLVDKADVIVAMNRPSLDKFEDHVKPGGVLVINSSIIDRKAVRDDIQVVYCDANAIAESIGNPKGANVAILGAVLEKVPVTTVEQMTEAIRIAGNVNGKTIRQLPVVTEVAALYRRKLFLGTEDGQVLDAKSWLRVEWNRSGLPLNRSNEACGVKNAATRKYLTADWLWYWPPGEAVEKMAAYCTQHGKPTNRPYFSLDGKSPITAKDWDDLRAVWHHKNGITNVWSRPPLADAERLKGTMERSAPRTYKPTQQSAAHLNQKPLDLMLMQVEATTNEGDVVWEPFGGLASASVASALLGRNAYVAEVDPTFVELASTRLSEADAHFREYGVYRKE